MTWYEGKSCALCGKPFGKVHWWDNKPALLGPDGKSIESTDLEPEKVAELLETHKPICWTCHLDRAFLKVYPDVDPHPSHKKD